MREFFITAPIFFVLGGLTVGFWNSKIWPWIKGTAKTEAAKADLAAKAAAANATSAASAEATKVVDAAENKI